MPQRSKQEVIPDWWVSLRYAHHMELVGNK
jgi:hypothetical protein